MSNIRVRSRLSITDLNDQISGATAPSNPEEKSLWLDTSVSPPILKYWDGSTWIPQRLDISELDPDLSITIETIEATMGNMANDNILDIKERGIVVDNINEIIGYLISNKTNAPATLPTIATLDASKKGNFYQTRATARNAGISTSANSYVAVGTAYNALASYLGNMTPIKPWDITDLNKDKNVTVVKDTFRQTWLNYYLAVQKLVEDTALQVKSQIDDHEDRITTVSAGFETLKDSIKLYATKDEVKNSLTAYPTKTEMDAQLNVKANEINLGIQTTITGLSSSDKNLLLKSNVPTTNQSYMIKSYEMSELMVEGDDYVFRAKLTIGTGKSWVGIWLDGGLITLGAGRLTKDTDGTYYMKFKGKKGTNTARSIIQVYIGEGSVTGVTSSIEWAKLTKSNIMFKQWTPAPEDTDDSINSSLAESKTYTNAQIKLNTENINLGIKKVEESVTKVSDNLNNLQIGNRNYFSIKAWNTKPSLSSSGVPYMDIKLLPNTQYTLSTNIPDRSGLYDVFFFKGTDVISSNSNGVAKAKPRTLTTDSDGVLKVGMREYDLSSGYWIMLSLGNKPVDWQPAVEDDMLFTAYSNSVDGTEDFTRKYPNKNLFMMKNFTYGQYITWTGEGLTVNSVRGASDYIPVEVGKRYSFSFGINCQFAVYLYKEYGDVKSDLRLNIGGTAWEAPNGIGNASYVSTPTPEIPSGYKYMRVSVLRGSADFTYELLRSLKIKIEEGLETTAYVMSIQDDSGKSEMGYLGYSPIDSNKASDYVWTVNPKVQRIFTSYSNSPDGTKDFTRDYPNENLLVKRAITGGNNVGLILPFHPLSYIGGSSNSKLNLTALPNNGFKAVVTDTVDPYFRPVNDVLASEYKTPQIGISFKYQVSDGARIRIRLIGFNGSGTNSTTYYTGSGQVNEIVNVVSSTNKTYVSIDILDATLTAGKIGAEAIITELKVSNGKALPYTTSPKDDPVKAEMAYIGYSAKDSTDPIDYTWSENPKARGTFIAYANSPDGKKDFTQFYPKENLLLNGRVFNTISNNNSLYPSSFEYLTEDNLSFVRTRRTNPTLNPTTLSIFTAIDIGATLATTLLGKKVGLSVEARASSEVAMNLMARYVGGATGYFVGDSRTDIITTEWKQVKLVVDSYPTGATTIRFNPYVITGANRPDLSTFYLDLRNWKIEILDPEYTDATPYTTPPTEDPIKAEMQYIGYSAKDSSNPSDYAWSDNPKVKGTFKRWANSPDGKTDFTDRYPNENELLDSRSPKVKSYQESNIVIQEGVSVPEWGATDAVKHTISGGAHATVAGTLATGILVEAGAKYVHSIYVKNTGSQYVRINNNLSQAIDVLPNETKKVVFNPSGSATGAAAKQFVIYRANASVTQEFILWHAKIEKSDTTETIWTSSPNDDYLGSVPQYVGIGAKNSNNPADFTWNLSPEYNQAITYTSVKEVELQLTPDSIYAKVAEAPDYIEWKDLVDSKPSIDDLSNVYDQLEGLSSADETILASMAELEMANNGVLTTITQAIEGMDGTLSTITDYMFFGKDGLTIGKSNSTLKVNISNTELAFYDNSTKVAWVDSQRLNIREALIEKKIKVGNHIIEKFDDKEEITIFKYDGI